MEQILKDFLDNNEANDAYVTSKVAYISIEDVQTLLNRQKEQLRLHVVGFTLPRPLEAWNEAQKLDVADYIDWHLEKEKSGN